MLTYSVTTSPGSREVNEDSVGVFNNGELSCFLLCDGLGGHGMGDAASQLVRDVFESQFSKTEEAVNFLGDAFSAAQDILMVEQIEKRAKHKMKTTAVALATDDRKAYIGHIGDSRLYAFAKNKVKFRTLDHSVPQMLVTAREIKEKEIRNHPDRNRLLRVMGIEWNEPMYELREPLDLNKYQAFLLCSDGFWELITEKEMCYLLKHSASVDEWLMNMTETVKRSGEGKDMDNFSAIAVWVSD